VCIDPRRTETAEKCHQHIALRPGTDGALALGLMHELIVHDWLDHDYIARHVEGWPAAARARAAVAARAGRRGLRHHLPTRCASWRATTARAAGGHPPELRHAARARRRQCGAADRAAALPGGRLAPPRRRPAAVSSGWFKPACATPRCSGPTCWPAAKPRTINMVTIGDDLLREASPAFGPRIEALVVYNSNPVAVAPDSPRWCRLRARGPVHRGAGALPHRHRRPCRLSCCRPPRSSSTWDVHTAYGHTYVLINQPAIAPLGQARPTRRSSARWPRAWASTSPACSDSDETLARQALEAEGSTSTRRCERTAGSSCRCPRRRLPTAASTRRRPAQVAPPGLGVPDFVPNHECAESRRSWPRATRWR
jgi:hypothetical protein